jgi:hypothetical protein
MNKVFAALLIAAYCYASNMDFEDSQLAHGTIQVAQK